MLSPGFFIHFSILLRESHFIPVIRIFFLYIEKQRVNQRVLGTFKCRFPLIFLFIQNIFKKNYSSFFSFFVYAQMRQQEMSLITCKYIRLVQNNLCYFTFRSIKPRSVYDMMVASTTISHSSLFGCGWHGTSSSSLQKKFIFCNKIKIVVLLCCKAENDICSLITSLAKREEMQCMAYNNIGVWAWPAIILGYWVTSLQT